MLKLAPCDAVRVNVADTPVLDVKLLPLMVGVSVAWVPFKVFKFGAVTVKVHCMVPVGMLP